MYAHQIALYITNPPRNPHSSGFQEAGHRLRRGRHGGGPSGWHQEGAPVTRPGGVVPWEWFCHGFSMRRFPKVRKTWPKSSFFWKILVDFGFSDVFIMFFGWFWWTHDCVGILWWVYHDCGFMNWYMYMGEFGWFHHIFYFMEWNRMDVSYSFYHCLEWVKMIWEKRVEV